MYTSYKQYDILNNKYIAARRNLDVQMSDMPRPSPPVEKNVTTPEVAKNKSSVKGKPAKGDTKATKGKLKKTTLADLDASGIMDWQVRLFTRNISINVFHKKNKQLKKCFCVTHKNIFSRRWGRTPWCHQGRGRRASCTRSRARAWRTP